MFYSFLVFILLFLFLRLINLLKSSTPAPGILNYKLLGAILIFYVMTRLLLNAVESKGGGLLAIFLLLFLLHLVK